jgi:hypothetical protein
MKLYMFRTVRLSETCWLSWQNKFVKLVHLVGFVTKKHVKRFCAACWEYQAHSGSDTTLRCRSNLQNIIIILSTGSKMGIWTYGWGSIRLMRITFTRSEVRLVKTLHMNHSPQTQGFVKWYLGKSTTSVRLRSDKVRISLSSPSRPEH